jgi:AmmeMemoRadiSam system protein B/AmmeMemoRadiSam system protein A
MSVPTTRPPAVAGMFYPGDAGQLARDVSAMLAASPRVAAVPKALIVPHAGYVYSGEIAASGYALLASQRKSIRRVVLFGPSHRVAFRGLAVSGAAAFATPLGHVSIDRAGVASALECPQVVLLDPAHAEEHSLEVQLPFLQAVLGDFSLVPLVVGQASAGEIADVMERLWGGPETLVLVSSDLSHYLPYAEARRIDGASIDDILHLRPLRHHEQACGATPINGLIELARRKGLLAHLIDMRNSGDTAGDKSRVVGYATVAFTESDVPAGKTDDDTVGATLLARARNAIAAQFGIAAAAEATHPALAAPGATFVTLTQGGQLRGCIGSLEAWRPLDTDVRENARAAAFRDPRFAPLTADELPRTRVEVSLLTPSEPMSFSSEADALRQLRPAIDGVIFECAGRRSTFLPQVWEQLPDPRVFMAHLKQKAGLPGDFWSPDVRLWRYEVKKWKEPEHH